MSNISRDGSEAGPSRPPEPPQQSVITRKRVCLLGAALALVVFMVLPVLTAFTPVLDGSVQGVGIGYIGGFVEVVLAVIGTSAYCAWADRTSRSAPPDSPTVPGEEPGEEWS